MQQEKRVLTSLLFKFLLILSHKNRKQMNGDLFTEKIGHTSDLF